MKKIAFVFIIAAVTVLSACHKEHNAPAASAKTYMVGLNVNFSQSITSFNGLKANTSKKNENTVLLPDTLNNYMSVLHCHVYDTNMHEIRNATQDSTDSDFGNFNFQLPNGTYTVVVDGGEDGFSEAADQIGNYTYPTYIGYPGSSFKGNTFYINTRITVNNLAVNFPLSLNRIVGRLEVVIQDAIPVNAKSLTVYVNGDAVGLQLLNLTPDYGNDSHNIIPIPGTTNTTIYAVVANTQKAFQVEIRSTDNAAGDTVKANNHHLLGDRVIPSVTCKANETTVLTGMLYGSSGQGFIITYDPTWDTGSPTTINFNAKH